LKVANSTTVHPENLKNFGGYMFLKSKFFRASLSLGLVLCLGVAGVLADTIRLKDGSVIKGKIVGFRDGQFVVSIGDGARARQMTFFADEVEAVEFDGSAALLNASTTTTPVKLSNPNGGSGGNGNQSGARTNQPNGVTSGNGNSATEGPNQNSNAIIVGKTDANKSAPNNSTPPPAGSNTNGSNAATTANNSSSSNTVINVGDPNTTTGANTVLTSTSANLPPTNNNSSNTTANPPNTQPRPKPITLSAKVLADNTANGWTNAGWHVKKGQKFRITARGQISLGGGVFAKPEGLRTLADDKKLMPNEATGGLIAVIGDDNNDFIFIGAAREFVAQRDGMLFLGVNENNLNDNSGSFDVTIEIEPLPAATTTAGN
jgi:hypothetical protein